MSKMQLISAGEESGSLTVLFSELDEDPHLAGIVFDAIQSTARGEDREIGHINVVITDDAMLRELNLSFLEIDEPTDVLAFDLSDGGDAQVEGDIYISLPRAREQAADRNQALEEEVARLAVHGFLHLCGWDHDDDAELASMVGQGEIYVQSVVRGG